MIEEIDHSVKRIQRLQWTTWRKEIKDREREGDRQTDMCIHRDKEKRRKRKYRTDRYAKTQSVHMYTRRSRHT